MTATPSNRSPVPDDTWTAQLEQLRARYRHVREPILAALNILQHDPDVSADDAKARAAAHGVRITAASINSAQRLLARQDGDPVPETHTPPSAPLAKAKRDRRPQPGNAGVDAEALIRGVVNKLQSQGNVEAERLLAAMRKAIELLQAAAVG